MPIAGRWLCRLRYGWEGFSEGPMGTPLILVDRCAPDEDASTAEAFRSQ